MLKRPSPPIPPVVEGKRVLVIDDVLTTGRLCQRVRMRCATRGRRTFMVPLWPGQWVFGISDTGADPASSYSVCCYP